MVLVTGPTGSGKNQYAVLRNFAPEPAGHHIMTAEDPVEFQLGGVNQVQMKEQIGLNFAAALRSFLRQDPTSFWSAKSETSKLLKLHQGALTGHLCSPRSTPTALRKRLPV